MGSRTLSWLHMCMEADPDWGEEQRQPDQYEFGYNRVFYHNVPIYDFWEFRLDDPAQGQLDVNQLG